MQREKMIARELGCLGDDFNDLQAYVVCHMAHTEALVAENQRRREASADPNAPPRGIATVPFDYPTLWRELFYIQERFSAVQSFVAVWCHDSAPQPEGGK